MGGRSERAARVSKRAMAVHYSSQTPEWATPQWLFDRLNAEFAFTLDVCATAENAKCPKFFTKEDDGLKQEWSGRCWMNPPYGREIGKWVQKAFQSASDGATVVCLIPARTDTRWFHKYCKHGEVRLLAGRLKFNDGADSAPFPSALVIFHAHLDPGASITACDYRIDGKACADRVTNTMCNPCVRRVDEMVTR